jgi:transcriptional regulator with XRE-family HTH domain
MSREEVARQLEWSTSTLFRIETGRSRPQPGNVRVLLELYGVTGPERDGLIQLARDARQPGWWHSFRDVLPNPYEVYIGLEAGAASIRNFEPLNMPGLLQTEDYVETLAGDIYLEERTDVDRYTLAFERLLAAALHPDDSLRLIEQVAGAMT